VIDLVCLVADQNMKAVVETLLKRHQSLGIRPLRVDVIPHPQHDPGCFLAPAPLLSIYTKQATHGLVLLDRDWDGVPANSAAELAAVVETRLTNLPSGWARCIVIDPELEAWLFTRSPRLDEALGWRDRQPDLASALASRSLWHRDADKPAAPKAAIKWALSQVGKQTSSSIYRQIAEHLGLGKCTDPSFQRFRTILQTWFPAQ
jgi:hypothetical protein